jgi:DNA (cytosine-5)-methyltransferase 1
VEERVAAGTVVDLFSGCGGFTLGAELAGFRSLVAVDVDPMLQSGYRRNFPRTRALQADVADLDGSDWRIILRGERPEGVIGGPPCQGFSWIGKRRRDDPRNTLVFHFYRHIALLQPHFFVMENVEGILQAENRQILDAAMELLPSRYRVVGPVSVSASDFGAATKRKRAVILGYDPGFLAPIIASDLDATGSQRVTVREAISDLPAPISKAADKSDLGCSPYPILAGALSRYARTARSAPPPGLGSAEARDRLGGGLVSGVFETVHSNELHRRYLSIEGGHSDPITKSYKLEWDGQCPTLRAGTGSERGSFQAVRPLHPDEGRVITVREAARLQGFPDWFDFHPTKWHSFRMIGNSVSPYVSAAIFHVIASKLRAEMAA